LPNQTRAGLPAPTPAEDNANLTPEPEAGAFAGQEANEAFNPAEEQAGDGALAVLDGIPTSDSNLPEPEGSAAGDASAIAPTVFQGQHAPSEVWTTPTAGAMAEHMAGSLGHEFYKPDDRGKMVPASGAEQQPPTPVPSGAENYSFAPSGQQGFYYPPGSSDGEGSSGGPNAPKSFYRRPYQGENVPGLSIDEELIPRPLYWIPWFTLPSNRGGGFYDWEEMGQCEMVPDPFVPAIKPEVVPSGGIPRLAVLQRSPGSTEYDLHMYTWASNKLKHYIAKFVKESNDRYVVRWKAGPQVTGLKGLFTNSNFTNTNLPTNPRKTAPPLSYHPGDMAIVYYWDTAITNPYPVLRFYFMLGSTWGQFKSPLLCATTTNGWEFTQSSVAFPARKGDKGWVTVPHAIRMLNGEWWMYYVGNIPEIEYKAAQTNPTTIVATPHSTRIQYSINNGVTWNKKYPSGTIFYPHAKTSKWRKYKHPWGLPNTRVDPDVVYLESDPKVQQVAPGTIPAPQGGPITGGISTTLGGSASPQDTTPNYRMYVKGEYHA